MSELDMQDALQGLQDTTLLRIIKKSVSDFEVVETPNNQPAYIEAVLEPISPQDLLIKPEGQRSWHWSTMWARDLLELDWVLVDPTGIKHRIISRRDWSRMGGYFQYELAEGATP